MKKILLALVAFSFFAGAAMAFDPPRRGGDDDPPHKRCPVGYIYNGRECVKLAPRTYEP